MAPAHFRTRNRAGRVHTRTRGSSHSLEARTAVPHTLTSAAPCGNAQYCPTRTDIASEAPSPLVNVSILRQPYYGAAGVGRVRLNA